MDLADHSRWREDVQGRRKASDHGFHTSGELKALTNITRKREPIVIIKQKAAKRSDNERSRNGCTVSKKGKEAERRQNETRTIPRLGTK